MTVVDRPHPRITARTHKQFQSLLLWMTVVDTIRTRFTLRAEIVSILVVVDDGRRRYTSRATVSGAVGFQSLLLWMTVVDRGGFHDLQPLSPRFNPCCCG